jgi:hypothetical protein
VKWRVWVLVALLGAAVVAGAFLLPRGGDGDERLAEAARAVLSQRSFRTAFSGPSQGYEDYIAPDRLRIASTLEDTRYFTTFIGTRLWVEQSCTTPTGTEQGYVLHDSDQPVRSGGTGWQMLVLASQADDAHRVASHRYAFTISLPTPVDHSRRLALRPYHGVATVRNGEVRTMKVTRGSQSFEMRFSHLGAVPPIHAPHGPTFDDRTCTFRLTPQPRTRS